MSLRIVWIIFERYLPIRILLLIYFAWSAAILFLNDPNHTLTIYFQSFLRATFIYSFANFFFLIIIPFPLARFVFYVLEGMGLKSALVVRKALSWMLLTYSVAFSIGHLYYWYYKNQSGEANSELTAFTVVALLNYGEIFYMALDRMRAQWVYRHIILNSAIGMVMTLVSVFLGIFNNPSPVRLAIAGIILFSARLLYLVYDQKNQVKSVLTGDIEPENV